MPSSCAGGMHRRRHAGQVLPMQTCSVTCTGTTWQLDDFPGALDPVASQVQSRNRDSSPPRAPPDGSVSCAGGRSRGVAAFKAAAAAGGWRPELDFRPGIRGGPPGIAWPSISATRRSNRSITRCCCRTVACRLGDDGDENIATGGVQVNFGIHSLDSKLTGDFDRIAHKFDRDENALHGLAHLSRGAPCSCPVCVNRQFR